MHLKDYYEILELSPSATIIDIKKAYRRLAHQFHPDKNQGDIYAATQFAAIKEAYEILTNPAKKEIYLQRRWYEQSIGKKTKQQIVTPATVIQQSLELERYVSQLDVFRMDKQGLKEYLLELLSTETIEQLKAFKDPTANYEIVSLLLKAMKPLPLAYTPPILEKLNTLASNDEETVKVIKEFEKKGKQKHKNQQYSLAIIIVITTLLCLLIWFSGR